MGEFKKVGVGRLLPHRMVGRIPDMRRGALLNSRANSLYLKVGVGRLELPTSCSQSQTVTN